MAGHAFKPTLQRQRQADLHEFEPSLVYRSSSRAQRTLVSKNQNEKGKSTWVPTKKTLYFKKSEKLIKKQNQTTSSRIPKAPVLDDNKPQGRASKQRRSQKTPAEILST